MTRPHSAWARRLVTALGTATVLWGSVEAQQATRPALEPEPIWAYGYGRVPKPDDTFVPQVAERVPAVVRPNDSQAELMKVWTLPGSDRKYTRLDFRRDDYPDWFPGDHPPSPRINSYGSESLGNTRRACAACHLMNGKGRPENAPPAGQPVAYTLQQLDDFATGRRVSADPRKSNTHTMVRLAQGMSKEDRQAAAEYYAAIPWTPWIRVIETDKVPALELEEGNMYIAVGTERTEPLGNRIVETPENELESNYLRSGRSGWNAYVPVGSLARGQALVDTGGGKTVACGVCHGPNLMGLGPMPGIAGRSPSYMMRQLWDMKVGSRRGPQAQLMKPIVDALSVAEMTDIVAYLASVMPLPGPVAPPTRIPAP